MKDTYDKFYDAIGYIILIGLLVAYFFLQASILEMPVLQMLQDFRSIVHILFTITANVFYSFSSIWQRTWQRFGITLLSKKLTKQTMKLFNMLILTTKRTLDYIVHLNELEKNNAVREFLLAKTREV